MPDVTVSDDLTLHYERHGDPSDPTVLLVMGLGAQMIWWDDGLVAEIISRGFEVIRFDNRDVGLSSKTPGSPPDMMALLAAAFAGAEPPAVPYTLSDMAADAVAVLDACGVDQALIVGASMGGMIVQTMAIEHPDRVSGMVSIMSTTGSPDVGRATDEAMAALMTPPPPDREGAIERTIATGKVISGSLFDPDRSRAQAERSYDRNFHPEGVGFQMAAIVASGDRTERLGGVTAPTTVIHGTLDPLVTLSGGEATAAAIPGAELLVFEEMGHDTPPELWGAFADAIVATAAR